jgi:hypothetical protein
MMIVLGISLSDLNQSSLGINIEPIEGHEKGSIHLERVSIFKTPSGTILIYGYEN